MKAKNISRFLKAAIFASIMLISFSCQNAIDTHDTQSKKANITVQLCSEDEAASRTIMPSYQNSDFTSIVLSGSFNKGETKVLKTWDSYADLQDAEKGKIAELEIGDWKFTIECKITDGVAFRGTLSKTLSEGDNALSFALKNPDSGNGSIEVTLDFNCDTTIIKKITAKLLDVQNNVKDAEKEVTFTEDKATYTTSDVPSGGYIVIFTMYDGDDNLITQASELVSVAAGLTSKGTVTVENLNSQKEYTITYVLTTGADWDDSKKPTTEKITEFDEIDLPKKNPLALGYIVKGWYTTSGFADNTKITKIEIGTKSDILIYAKCVEGFEVTKDNVGAIATSLNTKTDLSKTYELKVIEDITNDTIATINSQLKSASDRKVILDLSEATGLTGLSKDAFKGCTNLEGITFPNGVTSLGESAFEGCTSLKEIDIPDGVTKIEKNTFAGCTSLKEIDIPDGVTSLGEKTFYGCTNLESITIPDSVTSIGVSTFNGCTNLESITIPDSVTKIELGTFAGCSSLTSITIPDSVTEIGRVAFNICTGLTSVIIGESVKTIGDSAFQDCKCLTSIVIPDSVESIGNSAFIRCDGLTSVIIGESVKTIGNSAFYHCDNTEFTSITIPASVTSIGTKAFQQTKITSATFEEKEGWKVNSTTLSSTDLSSESNAALLLKSTHAEKTWTRTVTP